MDQRGGVALAHGDPLAAKVVDGDTKRHYAR
jgi:hypothetical protein